ncbi:RIP metalloprotease RseP [Pseudaestuariivita rosea]|uniref:RIP metalloprotease RseP n=1 Tax=Pseudaestuariivita rosea TaxID=2763263 RepID=UPI001ABB5290|nr:RIP metalloprotease RseP [Pseudaestuariivita rosea]
MDLTSLIASFGSLTHVIVFFVIALSIIVAIHEYGHYIVGRWCGIHAEVFSIGFGPVLFSRHDKRGTKWQVAALPLGGYVKFLGDADAASGKDGAAVRTMTAEERRRTMHGAPLWARAATVVAGPMFNFISAILIFAGLVLYNGRATDDLVIDELLSLPDVFVNELQPGDQIVAIDGNTFEDDSSAVIDLVPEQRVIEYDILRDGQPMTVRGPHPVPPVVGFLIPRHPAADIDMRVGDVIMAVNGEDVFTFMQMRELIVAEQGNPVLLDVWREGQMLKFTLRPQPTDREQADGTFRQEYLIGVQSSLFFTPQTEAVGPWTALTTGTQRVWDIIVGTVRGLWNMATGVISTCNLNSPVGIAQASSQLASQGTTTFISFIGILSVAIGFLNLLPIPVLDGGHLLFHAYEAVRGKPPNDKVLNIMMMAGLTIMLSFMLFALFHDLFCP